MIARIPNEVRVVTSESSLAASTRGRDAGKQLGAPAEHGHGCFDMSASRCSHSARISAARSVSPTGNQINDRRTALSNSFQSNLAHRCPEDRRERESCNKTKAWYVIDVVMSEERKNESPISSDFELFFRLQQSTMIRLAYVLVGDRDVADIVQEAFAQTFRNWARVENPEGYVRIGVVNGSRSFHRRNGTARRAHRQVAERPEAVTESFDQALADAIARLPSRQQSVLALRYFEDLNDVEIAKVVGVRPSTVRSLVH